MLINKALLFAQNIHQDDTSGHDIEHIKRVLTNAQHILKFEPSADKTVVILSAILHDVDDYKLSNHSHNLETFLNSVNLPEELRTKITDVVENISFSKSGATPSFNTLEQKIVSDADKLDAMGAIGICRTVMYSAATSRPLFNENEFPIQNLTSKEYQNKDRKSNHSINHFFDKLLKLRNAMQTPTGKKMAEARHRFMLAFLKEFFAETNAPQEWYNLLNQFDS